MAIEEEKMKKKFLFIFVILIIFSFSSCSKKTNNQNASQKSTTSAKKTDLIVFAAASLKESLNSIKANYEKANPNINILYNFDSSGTLRTQLIAGASADIFISAAPRQMNDITEGKNDKGIALADSSTVFNFLENKVVLASSNRNVKGIKNFDDLANRLKNKSVFLCIGNSDVPVGGYTLKIFKYYNIDEKDIASQLTYAANVKEVTTQVSQEAVDCGIIYQTDAFSAGLNVVDSATVAMCGQVIYPMCILKAAPERAEAEKFYNYLKSSEGLKEFEAVGFVPAF